MVQPVSPCQETGGLGRGRPQGWGGEKEHSILRMRVWAERSLTLGVEERLPVRGCRFGWPGLACPTSWGLRYLPQTKTKGQARWALGSESACSTDEKVGGGYLGHQEVRSQEFSTPQILSESKSPRPFPGRKSVVPVCQVLSQWEHCSPMSRASPQSQPYGLATS